MLKIFAVITKEEDTAYWVSAPDLPGCFACGDSINEAIASFHEAVALHIDGLREDHIALPSPRSRAEVAAMLDEEPVSIVAVEIAV